MYVSRRASNNHGTFQFHLAVFNLLFTLGLMLFVPNPTDILAIFFSSGILYAAIEYRMHRAGIRKAQVIVYGKELSGFMACSMRGFTEGPFCCVPAFYLADCILRGQPVLGAVVATAFAAAYSAYSALMDKADLQKVPPEQRGMVGRRKMNSPKLVVIVPLISALALAGLFLLPEPLRVHGFWFLFGTVWVVGLFFIINGVIGVRLIELDDEETHAIVPANIPFSVAAFFYDALFEMGFLFVAFYLVTYYLGLFTF